MRGLCIKVLLRLGKVRASAEDILRAAIYQEQYEIDLTSELEFFCMPEEEIKHEDSDDKSLGLSKVIESIKSELLASIMAEKEKKEKS